MGIFATHHVYVNDHTLSDVTDLLAHVKKITLPMQPSHNFDFTKITFQIQ